MAHNALIHAGGWAPGYVVVQADFAALDQAQFKSLNADDGGTWAPAGAITIGGAGLTLTTPLHISGASSAIVFDSGSVGIDLTAGQILVEAGASLNLAGDFFSTGHFVAGILTTDAGTEIRVDGKISCRAGGLFDILNGGNVEVRNGGAIAIDAGGLIDLTGQLLGEAGSTVNLSGTQTFGGTNNITGATDISAAVTLSGAGHINDRFVDSTVDADHTYQISNGDVFLVTTLTADRVYVLSDTGAVKGSRMRFFASAVQVVTLKQNNTTTVIGSISGAPASTQYYWLDLCHNGAANGWKIVGGQIKP